MIEVRNLKKSFGSHHVLKGVDVKVNSGEIFFILGTSGTGKSVLLKILIGLLPASSGQVIMDGDEITHLSEQEFQPIRKKCGMVFQQPALFDSLSVYENVAFGLRKHMKLSEDEIANRVQQCLKLVNIKDVEDRLPQQISYGMQKRVSLARTIAVGPKILLFDEPTTGLDPITTNAVNKMIFDLSRELKTTSVVVSHDMNCALEIADRIMVLDQGEIVALGTPQEIKKSTKPLVVDFLSEVMAHV